MMFNHSEICKRRQGRDGTAIFGLVFIQDFLVSSTRRCSFPPTLCIIQQLGIKSQCDELFKRKKKKTLLACNFFFSWYF